MQTQRQAQVLGLPGMRTRIGVRGTIRSAAITAALALWLAFPIVGRAQPAGTTIAFVTERKVAQLPAGPLFWRVETFPSRAAAQAAAGPTGLVGEMDDRVWLFTLGPSGGASPGGTQVAEVGPLSIGPAAEYLIQVQGAITPPGGASQVHTHPGSEAWYVVAGQQTVRTSTDEIQVLAGQGFAGFPASTPIRLINEGRDNRHAFPMFVIDAAEPQTSPAEFSASLPDSRQAAPAHVQTTLLHTNLFDWPLLLPVLALGVAAAVLMAGLVLRRSRRSL
jgi:quercetin dioxygenase-like cupin family protein